MKYSRFSLASSILLAACASAATIVACSSDDPAQPVADSGVPDTQADVTATDSGPADAGPSGFASLTIQEQVLAKSQSPLPPLPANPTNKYADLPAAATLGQMFYYEKGIAGPILQTPNDLGKAGETGKVSCASCHVEAWGSDTRSFPNALSLGTSWTTRNTTPIVNAAFYEWFYWDGRSDSLWQQAALAGENNLQQGSDRLRITHNIYTKYKAEYEAVFAAEFGPLDSRFDPADPNAFPATGKPGAAAYDALSAADKDIITRVYVNWAKAIEAYERKLISRNAPWDKFVAGDDKAISPAAIQGYELFVGKAYCVNCHSGPLFSDSKTHNIGVPSRGGIVDNGRADTIVKAITNAFLGSGKWSDNQAAGATKIATQTDFAAGLDANGQPKFDNTANMGMFRTKHLREIDQTGPYFHNGSSATLEDVLALYNEGGGDGGVGTLDKAFKNHVKLTPEEEAKLLAFLKTLTGDLPPADLLKDTSKP